MNLDQWFRSLQAASALELPTALSVQGNHDRHLGPRWERAGVRLRIEPSSLLEVVTGQSVPEEAVHNGFADATAMGVLDVLMTAGPHPIKNVRIIIEQLDVDPIESSQHAFRMAGRDAARKLLAQIFSWILMR